MRTYLFILLCGLAAAGYAADKTKSSSASDDKPVKEEFKEIGHAFKNGGRAVGHIFKKGAKAVEKALDGDGGSKSSNKKSDR